MIADRYTVLSGEKKYICSLSGKLKFNSEVYVGDYVDVEPSVHNSFVITRLMERENLLVRPFVANVDALVIFVSTIPYVDLYLVDKLLVDANKNGVDTIILINKTDLDENREFSKKIINDYGKIVKIFETSCEKNEVPAEFLAEIKGKLVAFGGQSATGKTTLINLLLNENLKTGGVSRIERGKNTTRHIEIFAEGALRIVDTCGFSQLSYEMKPAELAGYYEDYSERTSECKYRNKCTHTAEPDCKIKELVESGELSRERYSRYLQLFAELKDIDSKKY